MPHNYAIVGGGMLGLSLAHMLRKRGDGVTVFEASPALGGMAAPMRLGDITWDRFYHVILYSDLALRELLGEIGLGDELEWVTTKTGFYLGDGRMVSMSSSFDFLKFPPLNLIDKFRLAATIMHASRIKDAKGLEAIPVVEWLEKWSGRKTTRKIWLPLLRAKLGEYYREASAAFLWAIIRRMYAARRSGLKREMMGYVRGGYDRIVSRFAEHLSAGGVELHTSAPVRGVRSGELGPTIELMSGEIREFDGIILTCTPEIASRLCPALTPAEHAQYEALTYQGIVCASMLLDRPLTPYYVTNITDESVPFTAVIEMTALVDPTRLGGNHIIYLPKYVDRRDPLYAASDEQIRASFLGALAKMHPGFSASQVKAFAVNRLPQVFAVPTLHYSDKVPPIRTSLPGVSLITSAQIVNGTLNVDEAVQLARRSVEQIHPAHSTVTSP